MKKIHQIIFTVSAFVLASALSVLPAFLPEVHAESAEEFSVCADSVLLDGVSELSAAPSGAIRAVVTKRGFESDVVLEITVNNEGKIGQISVIEEGETPALGGKVLEKEFLEKFTGLDDFSEIDAMTGATHTFDAVDDCAGTAVKQYKSFHQLSFDADMTDEELFLEAAKEYLGEDFRSVDIEAPEQYVEAACSGENGWAVFVSGNGYYEDQMIKLAVMFDPKGKVSDISVISQHETAENGDQVFKDSYLNFFKGGKKFALFDLGDGSTVINTYSGATVSSFGVCRLVNAASSQVEALRKG